MKKILSLALALLMMLPLAIGTSAADNKGNGMNEVAQLIASLNGSDKHGHHHGTTTTKPGNTTEWTHNCQNCKYEKATYYTVSGTTYCLCPKCCKNNLPYIPKFGCDCPSSCEDCALKVGCQICTVCTCDHSKDCVPGKPSNKPSNGGQFNHKWNDCDWSDIKYGNGNWICGNCGSYGKLENGWFGNYWKYDVVVSCTRGGTYTMNGSAKAYHGETRTIKFEANNGYVLYDVTVDGESYGPVSQLELTVTEDLYIKATFVNRINLTPATITTSVVGNGTIKAIKNGQTVNADKFTVNYDDSVTLRFNPLSSSYAVKDVTVNGKSMGAIKSYTFAAGLTKDVDVKVTYKWVNPYSDVADNYLNAVEYVTEAGIMGYYNKYVNKTAFGGTKEITVKNLAAALAEMADVNEKLSTAEERIAWADAYGIIDADANLDVPCKVQTACDIVDAFLAVLEDAADVSFKGYDDDDTAKENALSIGLVSEKTYTGNRTLTRYDLASICYLLSNLDVK